MVEILSGADEDEEVPRRCEAEPVQIWTDGGQKLFRVQMKPRVLTQTGGVGDEFSSSLFSSQLVRY